MCSCCLVTEDENHTNRRIFHNLTKIRHENEFTLNMLKVQSFIMICDNLDHQNMLVYFSKLRFYMHPSGILDIERKVRKLWLTWKRGPIKGKTNTNKYMLWDKHVFYLMNRNYGEYSTIEFNVIKSISVMSLFLYSNQSQIDMIPLVHRRCYHTDSKCERRQQLYYVWFRNISSRCWWIIGMVYKKIMI